MFTVLKKMGWLLILPAFLWGGGLVTGTTKHTFISGDKVLFETDFKECPVGELPEGFEKIEGVGECVRFNDRIWVAGTAKSRFALMKKIDLGKEDFSLEFDFLPIDYKGSSHIVLQLFYATKDGWNKEKVPKRLAFDLSSIGDYCDVKLQGTGILTTLHRFRKKNQHVVLQVRRGQMRIYLNGKRLASIPFTAEKEIAGFAIERSGMDASAYDTLISGIKVAKYTEAEAKPTPEKLGIGMKKTKEGMKLTIPEKILFDFNRFILKPEAKEALSVIGDIIREDMASNIVVTGYTDNIGNDAYNVKLSLQRAQSVADYLIYCEKVDPALFKIEGKGKGNPIAKNTTEKGRAKNRRVEIRIVK